MEDNTDAENVRTLKHRYFGISPTSLVASQMPVKTSILLLRQLPEAEPDSRLHRGRISGIESCPEATVRLCQANILNVKKRFIRKEKGASPIHFEIPMPLLYSENLGDYIEILSRKSR